MIRRIAAPPHGFDERVPIASDWLFWVETLIGGGRIYYIDEVLARHRRHSSNVTTFDVRIPSLSGIQDHLISTEIILSLLPGKSRFVRFRRAYLYSQLRWRDDGIHYDNYLLLSLRNWFRLKVLIALAASRFIGFRR